MSESSEASEPISVPSDEDQESTAGVVSVGSVQVAEMDEEHEKCAAALNALVAKPTESALRLVLREFTTHFTHEEEMLDTYLYNEVIAGGGASAGGFSADASARRSHHADHARMLSDIKRLLAAAATAGAAGAGAGSAVWQRSSNELLLLRRECVEEIVSDFEGHADLYDGMYAERLSAALAAEQQQQQATAAAGGNAEEAVEDGSS